MDTAFNMFNILFIHLLLNTVLFLAFSFWRKQKNFMFQTRCDILQALYYQQDTEQQYNSLTHK